MSQFFKDTMDILTETELLNIVAALAALLLGWIVALLVRNGVKKALQKSKLSRKLAICLPEEDGDKAAILDRILAGTAFAIVMLLTLLVCFSALNLSEAASPLQAVLDKFLAYLPNLTAAALLIFVAWLICSGLKYAASLLLCKLRLDERIENMGANGDLPCELSGTLANTAALLGALFFLPAILNALKIGGITEPLQEVLQKVLLFLPNLAAAAAITVAGLIAAGILRKLVRGILGGALPEKLGIKHGDKVAEALSIAVYALVALPVIAAALDALNIEVLSGSTGELFSRMLNAAGNIFGALVTVFAAWLAGTFAAGIVTPLLESFGFNRMFHALGLTKKEETPEASKAVGRIVQLGVILFGILGGLEVMGFDYPAELIRGFIPFAANLLLAAAVFLIGVYLANLASGMTENTLLRWTVRLSILFLTGAMALHATGIGSPIIQTAFALLLGAVAVAAAIAFGLGGRELAAKKLDDWLNRK